MPTLKQMHYFLTVARTGSFSKAAARLHVAQPALSTHIANLEAELEEVLLVRHSRGVVMTTAGKLLADRSADILGMVDDMVASIRALQGQVRGRVRMGMPTTTTAPMALPLLDAFEKDLPGITLTIVEGMTGHLQHWLENDEMDMAILLVSQAQTKPNHIVLGRERLCLIGPHARLNVPGHSISFARSLGLPLVTVTAAHNLRRYLDAKASTLGLPINVIAEIDSLAQIKNIVMHGTAYTILPKSAASPDWMGKRINFWDIEDADAVMNLAVATSPAFSQSELCEPILRTLRPLVQRLIDTGAWPGGEATA